MQRFLLPIVYSVLSNVYHISKQKEPRKYQKEESITSSAYLDEIDGYQWSEWLIDIALPLAFHPT